MDTERPLKGQIAVVTGAGRGIGAAVVRALGSAGASLVLASRSPDQLEAVADDVRAGGGHVETVAGDLTDDAFVDALFATVAQRHGKLDMLVNNAGGLTVERIESAPPAALRDMLEINTVAPYACMRQAVMLMREGDDDGRIVNIGSTQAYWPWGADAGLYTASKFALRALTMSVSKQLKQDGSGIRVCMVNPGGADTTMVNPTGAPNPYLVDPDHIARAVLHAVVAPPGVHVFDTIVLAQPWSPW